MNKNFDLDKTGKEMPYKVPDGFFAELEANVAAELERFPAAGTAADSCGRHRGKRAVFMGAAIAAAAAAAFFLMTGLFRNNGFSDFNDVEKAFAQLDAGDREYLLDVYENDVFFR